MISSKLHKWVMHHTNADERDSEHSVTKTTMKPYILYTLTTTESTTCLLDGFADEALQRGDVSCGVCEGPDKIAYVLLCFGHCCNDGA